MLRPSVGDCEAAGAKGLGISLREVVVTKNEIGRVRGCAHQLNGC